MIPHRGRRVVLLVCAVLATALVSGCLQLNASMTIDGDDRVSGDVLVSAATADNRPPIGQGAPAHLADRVRIDPYSSEGRVGSHLSFHDLSFAEFEQLVSALGGSDTRYDLNLSRSGSLTIFDGSVDLTPLADTNSTFQFRMSAPGEVSNTNGEQSAGTVEWNLQPGEVTHLAATYQYASPAGGDWVGWAALVGLGGIAVSVGVGMLALRTHIRNRAGHQV
ncbi:DUF3153 domain-containing protein [Saccharopolyspora sp. HNM0983]|uniref:DUF3153 domain-containing protein n=1 Tax=Saccharopolyspora montiporae TaxID=2781240 RepID=A0A929B802_9PSEU|nr:DUF3153 domain-containing protein [Saccharopolyspora sp. HNM0983]MBE9373121.1 DUF3153 domain-containing protein [Saccharopolyspora sp. HNM0983]